MIKMPEPPLYLILHKVRGEPAYDVAYQIEVKAVAEHWWIIPTSGHRAYPLHWWKLEDLVDASDYPHARPADLVNYDGLGTDFDDLPDHYSVGEAPKEVFDTASIITALGIAPPPLNITRRKL